MAIIETDNPYIEKELIKLENLVTEGGGGIHSDLVMFSEGGGLAIKTKEPMERGREIIRLSRDVLLPSDKYIVSVKGEDFEIAFPKDSTFSTLQKKIGESMITLYNLTKKVQMQKEFSFLLSVADYPGLVDAIGAGRGLGVNLEEWRKKVHAGLEGDEFNRFISETFLKTRHLGYNDHIRSSSVSILMPIVDFMNHHWNGENFKVGAGVRKGDLAVNTSQPIPGSLECFAFYNAMDALDALLRYDFIDEFAPVVRSVPVSLPAGDFGVIEVSNLPYFTMGKKLPQAVADLNRFLPSMSVDPKTKILKASHLMIPVQGSPLALRRVLQVLLVNLAGEGNASQEFFATWLRDSEAKVIEQNKTYYKGLLEMIVALVKEKGPSAGLARMQHLCELQLGKIANYVSVE